MDKLTVVFEMTPTFLKVFTFPEFMKNFALRVWTIFTIFWGAWNILLGTSSLEKKKVLV